MENKNNSYYQLGAYSTEEMPMSQRFVIEKSALDDDFLFESLEGYSLNEALSQKHLLDRFDQLVEEKRKNAVVRKLVPYRWIAGVAASIIVFSSIAYFYNGNNGIASNENQIVENDLNVQVEEAGEDMVDIGENNADVAGGINVPTEDVANEKRADVQPTSKKKNPVVQNKNEPAAPQIALNLEPSSANQSLRKDDGVSDQVASDKVPRVGESIEKPLGKKKESIKSKKAFLPPTNMEMATESAGGVKDFLLDIPTEKQISDWVNEGFKEAGFVTNVGIASTMVLQFTNEKVLENCTFQEGDEGLVQKIKELLIGKKLSELNDKMLQKRLIFRYKSK